MIKYTNPSDGKSLHESDSGLKDTSDNIVFPYKQGAFRCVPDTNYSANFGFQWNKFSKTQLDKSGEQNQSKNRFFSVTKWNETDLSGCNVLEVGSGAGRFTEVVLTYTKANLYSVDYSNAVEANYRNNASPRLKLFQASVYEMPFEKNQFDKVFCFGVLQHTPDFKKSIQALVQMVKPGGELIVDFYPITGFWTKLHAKYLLRPFTRKMNHEKLLSLIENNIDWLIRAHLFFNKIGLGKIINRFLPVCDITSTFPKGMDKKTMREWCILDTFDMFSPEYDNPQKIATVSEWLRESGMKVTFDGFVTFGDNQRVAVVKSIK